MTVATLTRNVRLSEETIRRCLNIIENSDLNPQDTNRTTDTLAEIFYRNGGFDTTINRKFSESAIKKILRGRFADELSVREFLFFLTLIPKTDPEGGIDEFLDKNLIISPYPLSREKLNFDGVEISLSHEASQKIKEYIQYNELSQGSITTQYSLPCRCINFTLNRLKSWPKATFERILTAFLENGVITLPEGETLENLLSTDQEPPHTLTKDDIDFKENKVFLSKQGRNGIKDVIKRGGFNTQEIVGSISIGQNTFYKALRGDDLIPSSLETILQGLIAEGVIAPLPKGQTLGQLLSPKSKTESSYTPTPKTLTQHKKPRSRRGGGIPIEPYPLSDGDIVFKGNKVSFSKAAGQKIQSRITQKQGLNQTIIGESCNLRQRRISRALLGDNFQKQTFADILMALMEHGVIQFKDPNLGQLLDPKSESSYTPNNTVVSTGKNCAAVGGGGGGDSSTHSALTILRPEHIDHSGGR